MSFYAIIVLLVFVIPSVTVASYHLFLGIVGLTVKRRKHQSRAPKTKIAIIIPAHNEAASIETAINSVHKTDYPAELLTIYVVADNCTDQTAEIAQKIEAEVIVRDDTDHRGKGYALNDVIPKILKTSDVDGLFFMDADSQPDVHAFRSIDYFAQRKGGRPLQLNNVVASPDETPLSYLFAIANCLENDFFYAPKSYLNLFSILRGTGMYFPRELAECFSWNPKSLVEDTDLTLELLKDDVTVAYIPEASVHSEYPSEERSMSVQRKRWIGGTVSLSLSKGIPLFFAGLLSGSPLGLDAGLTLLVLSRPMVILQLIATTILSLLLIWPLKASGGGYLLTLALLCWVCHFAYFTMGVVRLGLTPKRTSMLLTLPKVFFNYFLFSCKTLVSGRSHDWERTPRKAEDDKDQKTS